MDEIMSKILKKFVCENGDCRGNEFKIGPLISLIAVNILIAASLAVFIEKWFEMEPVTIAMTAQNIYVAALMLSKEISDEKS